MDLNTRLSGKAVILPMSERELAVLRLLGRFGMVTGLTIRDLVFPDQHANTCRNMLHGLAERKLIWEASVPQVNDAGRSQGRAPKVYGLADDGRQMLDTFGAEPHDGTFERLIYRSKQAPSAPAVAALVKETYVSDWCASLLDQVRRTPMLAGAHVQRHYAVKNKAGELLQTTGAMIVLAFDPEQKTFERPGWAIPWLTDGAIHPSWRVVRLALEVDDGLMAQRALFERAQTYRGLSESGTYQKLLGGAVRPVILTPPGRRSRAVAEIWMAAWEGSPALLSSVERTCHPQFGVLWGEYLALKSNPVQKTTLLGSLLGTVDQWPAKTQNWVRARSNVSQVTGKKPA